MLPLGTFAAVLVLLEQVQGTSKLFSMLAFLFVLVAGVTFNLAGGLTRASGGYVFFYSLLGVIIGLVTKAVLGERADSNLLQPIATMEVFLGGICAMLVAVYVSRRLTRRRAFLQNAVPPEKMQDATLGCLLTGSTLYVFGSLLPIGGGSLLSALNQLNRFMQLAIILGVTHQIRKSGGTRSVNGPALVASVIIFVMIGILGFSKEAMLTPVLCWFVAAGAQRYRVTVPQVAGAAVAVAVLFYYLVPYSQDGRNYRSESGSVRQNAHTALALLSNIGVVRDRYEETSRYEASLGSTGYFNRPQGILDRLQMISVDDKLIDVTERGAVFGLTPVAVDFENLIPHFLWPDKPTPFFGNVFAHEVGGLDVDDTTTGVSFTASGEAYHLDKWAGVLVVAPLIWILLFVTMDSLCGDVRKSPWGLLVIALFAHVAPEGMLDGAIYTFGYGSLSVIFGALTSAYVMPALGRLSTGSRTRVDLANVVVRPLPKRVAVAEAEGGAAG